MLTIEQTDIYFKISFNYNQKIVDAIKLIPGRKYDPTRQLWTIPPDQQRDVDQLIAEFGIVQHVKSISIPDEPDPMPELTINIPLLRKLYHYQTTGVAQSIQFKRLINGDEPGLGKTTQAIATVIGADVIDPGSSFPCLIVCPATLKQNWQREIFTVAGMPAMILDDKFRNSWHQFYNVGKVKIFITNYESLKKYFVERIDDPGVDPDTMKKRPVKLEHIHFRKTVTLFKSVIIDEIHRCKTSATLQTKLMKGICDGKTYVQGLTGTPIVNKPIDLMSQLSIIGRLVDVGGYKHFIDRYCGGDGKGHGNLKELNHILTSTCFFQRRKSDVLLDLPDKVRQIVMCDIDTRTEYDRAIDDLGEYLRKYKEKNEWEIEKSLRGEIMVRIGICKNISARGKLNDVREHIDTVIESGNKIGVFIHQREIANRLLEIYPDAVSVRGDDSMDQRQINVDRFQNDPDVKIIICSIKAAGVGITLTAASRMCFVELPWHAADANQCEDRFHRIGQKDSVQCSYFLGSNTMDEWIYQLIESKRDIANQTTGNDESIQTDIINKLYDSLINKNNDGTTK